MIPFNHPFTIGKEFTYIEDAIKKGILRGDGIYTKKCHDFLEKKLGCSKILLTHSCTAALEMAAILLDLQPGDEVIMPSYTFVSTANAFVLRGAIPVFVDIRSDTLNINENLIEKAITPKTKAIVCVHYAGVACEMDSIISLCKAYNLVLIEDAAQALGSKYKGKNLGTFGDLACFSFHETKNIISGEGGCLAINNPNYIERAEIIREKGTNRSKFFRGQIDKYTWVDIGSSFLPSDMVSAFLYAQLEHMDEINQKRIQVWNKYNNAFTKHQIKTPFIPDYCEHNAHMYYLLFNSLEKRTNMINTLNQLGINTVFHYIPLHSSPAGKKFGRYQGDMAITNQISDTLLRLPIFYQITDEEIEKIIQQIITYIYIY